MKNMKNYLLMPLVGSLLLFTGCGDDDVPAAENEEEIINAVTLSFTPAIGGDVVTGTYLDSDGEGAAAPVLSTINLTAGITYSLEITMENTLESPVENITEEVEEEGAEHQLFFSWTDGLFNTPSGSGNIDASGSVNYQDADENGNPIGLLTSWTPTNQAATGGSFRVVLKHQPNIKSASSTSQDGETDVDITWDITISE